MSERDDLEEDSELKLIVCTNEEGGEILFEVMDVIEVDGEQYALAVPYEEEDDDVWFDDPSEEDEEEVEIHIFHVDPTTNTYDEDFDSATFEKVKIAVDKFYDASPDESGNHEGDELHD